jgi:hypothetical protein
MIYILGAIALCSISVRALKQSHKLYTSSKTISILYALVGTLSAFFAFLAVRSMI